MFRFDFRDKSLIPPILGTDNADYLERLMPVLERERIHPSGVVRLRDAAFCEERGIVQLSSSAEHTALLENDDYKRLGHRFGMDGDVIRNGLFFLLAQQWNTDRRCCCWEKRTKGTRHWKSF